MKISRNIGFVYILEIIQVFLLSFCMFVSVYAQTCSPICEQAKSNYFSGKYKLAVEQFIKTPAQDKIESDYYLGLIYLSDEWPGTDKEKGLSHIQNAADLGNQMAMWKIGNLYETGTVVRKNLLIAIDWYRKSQMSIKPDPNIYLLKPGKGGYEEQTNQEMLEKTIALAQKDNIDAQVRLARMYDSGNLIHRDSGKSFYWYQKAALLGNDYSMFMTGYFYCRGIGVKKDKARANYWLDKSGRKTKCN